MWQAGTYTDCLSKSDCASSTNGYERVGIDTFGVLKRIFRDVRRGVHCCLAEDPGDIVVEILFQELCLADLLRCCKEQWSFKVLSRDLVGQLGERAASKDDSRWRRVVFETLHYIVI